MFEAGALIFQIQMAGRQVFEQDAKSVEQATERMGKAAQQTATQTDKQGNATDEVSKKARQAKKPLDDQANATERTGREALGAATKQELQAAASERQAASARRLSVALLAAGVAVTALVGLSIAKFAQFDQGMSNVAAATMATADEQERLADAALDAGAKTAYSAREAAAAEEELAKAGLSVSDIVGGSLNASLALAAAGQLEVARSATIMATTLKQFRLPAEDAGHVADLLAAGAGKAQGSVDDLALALQYVGPVASGMGLKLEETVGTLALFAANGQLGERAGTGLRGVIQALVAPSSIASRTMKEYGINLFDGEGRMKSLAQMAQELQGGLGQLTEEERSAALGRIFGNEQITAARILYQGGAADVETWTDAVNDSGFAAEQAARRQDNLAGDIEKLGGAFDTALIKTGSGANDVLRDMVQIVTSLVDGYGDLDPAVQGTVLTIGIAVGVMLLFSGATLGVISRFIELKNSLETAGLSMKKMTLIAAGVGFALTAIVTVVGLVAQAQAEARAKAQAYADTLEKGTNRVTKATQEMIRENLAAKQSWWFIEGDSVYDNAQKVGISLELVTDAASGNVDALKELKAMEEAYAGDSSKLGELARERGLTLTEYSTALSGVVQGVKGESSSLEEAIRVAEQKNSVTEEGVTVTEDATDAYLDASDGVDDLASKLNSLIDAISAANGVGQDAISANIDYQDSLANIDEQIKKAREGVEGYALTLDQNTQAGRDNMQMLVGLAQNAEEAAAKQFALDGNTQNYRATLESSHQALVDRFMALGKNAEEAHALADQILRIPSDTEWQLIAQTQAAKDAINDVITISRNWEGQTFRATFIAGVESSVSGVYPLKEANGGNVQFFARGGENHIAQFARAGDWRVWAEPETGGEWYIPDAPAKRERSVGIAKKMADGWGYDLVPRNGGGDNPNGSSGGGSTTKITVNNYPSPGMDEDEFADKVVREIGKAFGK